MEKCALWAVTALVAMLGCGAPTAPPLPPTCPAPTSATTEASECEPADCSAAEAPLVFPGANSRETYFTIHNIAAAHELSLGAGIRVGILDHSFGAKAHPDLYVAAQDFAGEAAFGQLDEEWHGYWMALTLREIAPKAEIVALNTSSSDEAVTVDAMVRAIDWAIQHGVRVLTYSSRRFTPEHRPELDAAVDRALAAGIVTTFIHYPHEGNLLPSWLGGRDGDDEREPDVNILQYDYSVVFTKAYREWRATGKATGWDHFQPFLSISSTSPVTAGIVALMLSKNGSLSPAACKEILMTTARPLAFEGRTAPRAADARAAVERAMTK